MDNFQQKKETYDIMVFVWRYYEHQAMAFPRQIIKTPRKWSLVLKTFTSSEEELSVNYKAKILQHRFLPTLSGDQVILEVKSSDKGITEDHMAQTLNYLRVSNHTIGLIINFGKRRLEYKRLISSADSIA